MISIHGLLAQIRSPEHLIQTIGYPGMFFISFAESAFFLGFFLPGDSMLFVAGFLASVGYLNLAVLCVGFFISAVLGDTVGYFNGHTFGRKIFSKTDSKLFNPNHVHYAESFYKKYGKNTMLVARFIPVVRALAPALAGVGHMSYRSFFIYNLIGCALWSLGVTVLGYFLGSVIPAPLMDRYLLLIVGGVVVLSVLPSAIHYLQETRSKPTS